MSVQVYCVSSCQVRGFLSVLWNECPDGRGEYRRGVPRSSEGADSVVLTHLDWGPGAGGALQRGCRPCSSEPPGCGPEPHSVPSTGKRGLEPPPPHRWAGDRRKDGEPLLGCLAHTASAMASPPNGKAQTPPRTIPCDQGQSRWGCGAHRADGGGGSDLVNTPGKGRPSQVLENWELSTSFLRLGRLEGRGRGRWVEQRRGLGEEGSLGAQGGGEGQVPGSCVLTSHPPAPSSSGSKELPRADGNVPLPSG